MGYNGIDNKDIRVEVTSKRANKQILDAYLPDATAQTELNNIFSDLEKEMAKEKKEATKNIRQELKDLQREVVQGKKLEYGNKISGKISLEMMYRRMNSIVHSMEDGHERATMNRMDASIVLPVQIALNRANFPVTVDGLMSVDGETATAIAAFQKVNNIPVGSGLDLPTMQALAKYLSPSWEGEQIIKKSKIDKEVYKAQEDKKKEMMPGDKLEKAGDEKFAKGDYEDALNYYRLAERSYTTAAEKNTVDPGKAKETAKEQIAELDRNFAQKFLAEANRIMDEAKVSSGTKEYKEGQKQRAIDLLYMAYKMKKMPIDSMLSQARRNDNMGNLEYKKAQSAVTKAKTELARVEKSLDAAQNGKPLTLDENGNALTRGAKNPEKVPVWEKQVAFWKTELVKAEAKAKEFSTVVIDPDMRGRNLITNYVNSYFGPILEDPEQVPLPKEYVAPRSQPVVSGTREIRPEQTTMRDVITPQGRTLATIPSQEFVPHSPLQQGRDAMDFLQRHFTADISVLIEDLRNNPPRQRLQYFVFQGQTSSSIAAETGLPERVVRERLGTATPREGQSFVLAPGEGDPHLRAYITFINIVRPYMTIFARYPNPADYNRAVEECRAKARSYKLGVNGREYQLQFVR